MITSRTTRKLSEPTGNAPIPKSALAYIKTRNRLDAFSTVHREFKRSGIAQATLADRLGMDAGQLNRLLGAPGNWRLDTGAVLLWGISGGRIRYSVDYPLRKPVRNQTGPSWRADNPEYLRQVSNSPAGSANSSYSAKITAFAGSS